MLFQNASKTVDADRGPTMACVFAAFAEAPAISRLDHRSVLEKAKGPAVIRRALDLFGGAKGDRTPDLYNAIVALSQLSYGPGIPAGGREI
jgi:hypothetical protein